VGRRAKHQRKEDHLGQSGLQKGGIEEQNGGEFKGDEGVLNEKKKV